MTVMGVGLGRLSGSTDPLGCGDDTDDGLTRASAAGCDIGSWVTVGVSAGGTAGLRSFIGAVWVTAGCGVSVSDDNQAHNITAAITPILAAAQA